MCGIGGGGVWNCGWVLYAPAHTALSSDIVAPRHLSNAFQADNALSKRQSSFSVSVNLSQHKQDEAETILVKKKIMA